MGRIVHKVTGFIFRGILLELDEVCFDELCLEFEMVESPSNISVRPMVSVDCVAGCSDESKLCTSYYNRVRPSGAGDILMRRRTHMGLSLFPSRDYQENKKSLRASYLSPMTFSHPPPDHLFTYLFRFFNPPNPHVGFLTLSNCSSIFSADFLAFSSSSFALFASAAAMRLCSARPSFPRSFASH